MGFWWFGRKAAPPDMRPFVPAWLTTAEAEEGFARSVAGSLRVAVNGIEQATGWTLQPLGAVQFAVAPLASAAVTAGYLFDAPVRFGEDRIEVNRATFLAGDAPSVPLIEVREG